MLVDDKRFVNQILVEKKNLHDGQIFNTASLCGNYVGQENKMFSYISSISNMTYHLKLVSIGTLIYL